MHKQPQANSSSEPTARVANQNRSMRDVVPVDKVARSGTQPTESGSTHSARSGARKSSPPQIIRPLLARPANRPRRDTLHTVASNDHEVHQDEDGQQLTEIFHLSDDSSDEYQKAHISDETELDTEPETDENDDADGTRSITRQKSRAGDKGTNNRVSTV